MKNVHTKNYSLDLKRIWCVLFGHFIFTGSEKVTSIQTNRQSAKTLTEIFRFWSVLTVIQIE